MPARANALDSVGSARFCPTSGDTAEKPRQFFSCWTMKRDGGAVHVPRNGEEGPARTHRATSRVATAANFWRDIRAQARVCAGLCRMEVIRTSRSNNCETFLGKRELPRFTFSHAGSPWSRAGVLVPWEDEIPLPVAEEKEAC